MLQQRKFMLDIRKNFLAIWVVEALEEAKPPRKLWHLHSWQLSREVWIDFWLGLVMGCLASSRGLDQMTL